MRRTPVLASNSRAKANEGNPTIIDVVINPRQLSPSMGYYDMDDHDIDGEHNVIDVFEDAAPVANVSSLVGDGVAAGHRNVGKDEPVPSSSDGKYNSRVSI
ncbi:hypothetical protein GUJ93_ZPchr0011g28307 [Zizania palustris]|uniref:Uncharacterized protein n=1 Tax=Zizania palustris TaxID=103762 RepID=A0A8J5WMN3_ZIZPA|nr:hypothetical protein GUJ93_ZPchr0011g28307 [Zizania palustris]